MRALYNFFLKRLIRLGHVLSLIFFACYLLAACRAAEKEMAIVWENDKATGISIPKQLIGKENTASDLQVRLKDKPTSLLGQFTAADDLIIFKAAIPLKEGQQYEVYEGDRLIGSIPVSLRNVQTTRPELLCIYPGSDTLPENLLKIYLRFSEPMTEGQALKHVSLLDDKKDTVAGTFLDLQPELWNAESNVLTLWLDPGRIKRELIPNQKLGNPLEKGRNYSIAVSGQWKSAKGVAMEKAFIKTFMATNRDSIAPRPALWRLEPPRPGSMEPLHIILNEPLDYFLLQETVTILDSRAQPIKGTVKPLEKERGFQFFPQRKWQKGQYQLRIATYLEDLAGNSIERLFDRDIRTPQTAPAGGFVEKGFEVTE